MKFLKSLSLLLIAVVMFSPTMFAVASNEPVDPSELWSFGNNASGKTGLGTTVGNTTSPEQVEDEEDWVIISAGGAHTLVIKENGTLWTYGLNGSGRTGLGTTTGSTTIPVQIGTDDNWSAVSAGGGYSLTVKSDGTLWAFGANDFAQTGLGLSTGNTLVPTQIGTDTDWSDAAASGPHSLALKTNGTLWAFGSNSSGQTGLGTTTGLTLDPIQVGTDTNWSSITVNNSYSLTLKSDGTLWAFGSNAFGRTGLGTASGNTLTPIQVGTDSNWSAVSAGFDHALAVKENGTLWAFGRNANGRTGLGTASGNTLTPTQVGTDTDWSAASAQIDHSVAIKENGTLWAFGSNANGRTGLGTTTGNTLTPTQVGTDLGWRAVSAGADFSAGLKFTIVQPTVSTVGAAEITQTTADLSGEMLTSGNVPKDSWGFNYGTTDSYGSVLAGVSTLRNPGVFTLTLEGLTCGTEYHFQAYLTTSGGDVLGDDVTFTTTACEGEASSGGGSSSGGSTSIVRQYEIYIEKGEFDKAENLKMRWPRFFPEEVATSTTPSIGEAEDLIELVKKNITVFEQAKALGIVLPEFIETLLKQVNQVLQVRDLKLYIEGEDVLALQQILNQNGFSVAAEGEEGSAGNETTYFGPRTEAALIRYQTARGITPAAGYFGAITRDFMKKEGIIGVWW